MPISAEQKEANKIARRERDRAWRARYREREAAEKIATEALETEMGPEIERFAAAEKAAEDRRSATLSMLDEQIAALKRHREEIAGAAAAKVQDARGPLHAAYARRKEAQASIQRELDVRFPDLVGAARWSAATCAQGSAPSADEQIP